MEEKVIFRQFKDPYNGIQKYMCIFPDDEASPGNVCYVDIWQDGNGTWWHDCYEEIPKTAATKCRIVHKNDPVVPTLVATLKAFYGGDYKTVEKIVRGRLQ